MPYLIPPSTVNSVEHLYDKVGFKTHLTMDINYDDGYRLKGSSTWWAAKSTVWVMTAVRASDQVRQHLAWALAQIVVVGAGFELRAPELWLSYYDIMVRNALGNFRDILQEVTYSPVMGTAPDRRLGSGGQGSSRGASIRARGCSSVPAAEVRTQWCEGRHCTCRRQASQGAPGLVGWP